MKDFKLTISSLGYFVSEITKMITSNQNVAYRINIKQWRESRSLNQNAFQHVIYDKISVYLISKGRKDWTPKFTKKNMKNKFIGWINEEFTDPVTGEKEIKEVLRHSSSLDVAEAYEYTTNLLDWAESIGCYIEVPAICEYRELMESQNK